MRDVLDKNRQPSTTRFTPTATFRVTECVLIASDDVPYRERKPA